METTTRCGACDSALTESTAQLAELLSSLRQGMIVAASVYRPGIIRIVVENKRILGRISDSWQRLVVTLHGCETFLLETSPAGMPLEDPRRIGARGLRIQDATTDDNRIRIACETPIGTARLLVAAESFALMLGSGRPVTAESLLHDIQDFDAA